MSGRKGLAECLLGSISEGHFGRIGHVGCTIVDNHACAEDAVAEQGTFLARGLESLFASKKVLLRNGATGDLLLELVLRERAGWLYISNNAGIVSGTTSLFLEKVVERYLGLNCLTVGDLWLTHNAVDLVFTTHALDIDVQMQLTHTGDDGFLRLGINVHTEGRVLTLETSHSFAEVGGVLGLLGLDGKRNDGFGDEHGGHGVAESTIGEGISRSTIDAKNSADFSSADLVHILHLVGVHAYDTGDLDLFVGASVVHVGTLAKRALVNADVGELAKVALFELKGKADKWESVVGDKLDRSLLSSLVKGKVLDLCRVGQVIDDSVKHRLDRLVCKSGTHQDRGELEVDCGPPDGSLDLGNGGLLLVKEEFGNLFIDISQGLDEGCAPLLADLLEISRDFISLPDGLSTGAVVVDGFHSNDVDDTLEVVLGADGHLDGGSGDAELLVDLVDSLERVGTHAIHLVDEGKSGNVVSPHLSVDGDCLRLDTADGAQNHDSTVEDSQGSFNLDGEVNMSGCVDQVDVVLLFLACDGVLPDPVTESGGRLDSDTLFTLKIHAVHLGTDRVLASDFVDGLDTAGVEEDTLGGGCLATVDVCLLFVSLVCTRAFSFVYIKPTAMPMFLRLSRRDHSCGSRLSTMAC